MVSVIGQSLRSQMRKIRRKQIFSARCEVRQGTDRPGIRRSRGLQRHGGRVHLPPQDVASLPAGVRVCYLWLPWCCSVAAVQHERGPRHSTLRRQISLCLKNSTSQAPPPSHRDLGSTVSPLTVAAAALAACTPQLPPPPGIYRSLQVTERACEYEYILGLAEIQSRIFTNIKLSSHEFSFYIFMFIHWKVAQRKK